jgi:hypothetical protein
VKDVSPTRDVVPLSLERAPSAPRVELPAGFRWIRRTNFFHEVTVAKKQLRTVKKSNRTGRLNRNDVRAAVIDLRDGRDAGAGAVPCATGHTYLRRSRSSSTRSALTVAA